MMKFNFDTTEILDGGAIIQSGHYNDRIYLMKVGEKSDGLPSALIAMATQSGFGKVFAKVPPKCTDQFINAGFVEEALVPGFYNGSEPGFFMAYYLQLKRVVEPEAEAFDAFLEHAVKQKGKYDENRLDRGKFTLRQCSQRDVVQMAEVYKKVFPSYPFPIYDPAYLLEAMSNHVDYFCIEVEGEIVALSSAEMDPKSSNVEMTDFATLPEWRGNGLAAHLLCEMGNRVKARGVKTAYTIARAASPGMNITFSKLGYSFCGRLPNNTNIAGSIESMNVWHKSLSD